MMNLLIPCIMTTRLPATRTAQKWHMIIKSMTFHRNNTAPMHSPVKKTDPDPPNPGILGKTGQKKQSEMWRKLSGYQRPPQKSTLT